MKEINALHYNRQPKWFNGLNTLWKGTYPLGTQSNLSKDSLIRAAKNSTGLTDFGKDFWDEPLDRMLDSINREARLHPIGQFISRQRLIQLLSVRLRAESCFKKHPEILEQQLYPVMVIVGLQRTGTTKLHRLLAADPENRALLSWEALNPAPLNGDIKTGKDRIKAARISEKALKYMSPGFFAIHPVEHLAPEEDVLLLDVSFLSTTAEATMHVPSYSSWLEKTDQSQAYAYMAKLMKLLQWQRPAKRWVLKTPHHLEFPGLVKQHFGDVQFIWTHRDVYKSIPSFLSMVSFARILFSDQVSPSEVAEHWLQKNRYMLSKAIEFYQAGNSKYFTHIHYNQLVDDAQLVLKNIYNDRGENINDDLSAIFKNADHQNPQGKYGLHQYKLEDFGINKQILDKYTNSYQAFQKSLEL